MVEPDPAARSRRPPVRPGLEVAAPIDETSVFRPDVWWSTPEHFPAMDTNRHPGPPDLVIEVRSPTTWGYDRGRKKHGYEAIGVPELWLVDPVGGRVLVFRRSPPDTPTFDVTLDAGEGETLTTPIIPGFGLDVTALSDR